MSIVFSLSLAVMLVMLNYG